MTHKTLTRQVTVTIINICVVAILTFFFARLENNIERMNDKQDQLAVQQERTQHLLEIEYYSTHWALTAMFDGEYTELKCSKKQELMGDYNFKQGD